MSRLSGSATDEDAAIRSVVMESLALGWMARHDDPDAADRVRPFVRRLVEKLS